MMILVLSACGAKKTESTADEAKPVAVEQYITTHSWVVSNDSTGSSGSSGKSSDSSGSGSSDGSGGSPSSDSGSGSASGNASSDRKEAVEDSVPVIVATIPDDKDLADVPDL